MSQASKPTGLFGRILARGMAWGHKTFYVNAAKALDLRPEDRLLEIGFGSGWFIRKHASKVLKVCGLDISEDMVRLAIGVNRKMVDAGRADFRQGDVNTIPWPDGEFSAVIGIETFYFWPEPKKAIEEIFRVLTPGGRVVIEMGFNKNDGLDHTKHVRKYGIKLYSGKEMVALLEQAGFTDIEIIYYKGLWMPIRGHVVPKGMIAKAFKRP